jgi:hypothetical protein
LDSVTDPERATVALHVGIDGENALAVDLVLDINKLSIPATVFSGCHDTLGDSKNRRTGSWVEVNATVVTRAVPTGCDPVTKT